MGYRMTEETDLKNAVKQYLDLKHIFNYHLLQGLGCYKGVPDRVMHYRGKVHYLEIKKPKGRLSLHQQAFAEQCAYDDIDYVVIRSLDDLIDYLEGK
jgi:hypothetical protein